MDNHPIPQDVTGYKFKLIGSMTVRQFLYLFGAGVLCYGFYVSNIFFPIKFLFIMVSGFCGFALAFLPLEGRPLDKMIYYFIRAIPRENQYIYRKVGAQMLVFTYSPPVIKSAQAKKDAIAKSTQHRRILLLQQLKPSSFKPDIKEADFLKNIQSFFEESALTNATPQAQQVVNPIQQTPPQPQVETPTPEPEIDINKVRQHVLEIQKQLDQTKRLKEKENISQDMDQKLEELQKELSGALEEKQQLEKKLMEMSRMRTEKIYRPSTVTGEKAEETANVRTVNPQASVQAGFPTLPDRPNVLLGIVKDPRGRILPNILVEVMDKNNIPVRAFKTNQLGQFAAATQLSDGTYKIIFDDPLKQNDFDTIEITLNGNIFNPIEVISVDQRERLRRELFESTNKTN